MSYANQLSRNAIRSSCRACEAAFGCEAVAKSAITVRQADHFCWTHDCYATERSLAGSAAAMYGLAPTVYPLLKKPSPCCIYVLGLFVEAVFGFWPKLEKLVVCRLQSGLEGQ
ncbi:hypothetical protein ACYZT2_02055 [Pseudomonas sp. MDT1-85]